MFYVAMLAALVPLFVEDSVLAFILLLLVTGPGSLPFVSQAWALRGDHGQTLVDHWLGLRLRTVQRTAPVAHP